MEPLLDTQTEEDEAYLARRARRKRALKENSGGGSGVREQLRASASDV